MAIEDLTSKDLDYLQRTDFKPPPFNLDWAVTEAPLELRTLVRVESIGRLEKDRSYTDGDRPGSVTGDLLASLYNYKVPLSFLVNSEPGRASLRIGTWLPAGSARDSAEENGRLLDSALCTLYPAIEVIPAVPVTGDWELGGLALGIPTAKPLLGLDDVLPFDRLLRALSQVRWAAMVLAQPVPEARVGELRLQLINEMRSVQTASKAADVPSPLLDEYVEMLGLQLKSLRAGQRTGMWRTAVYLMGDADAYYQVMSLWRGIFSGEGSLPEPVRVWDRDEVPMLAASWAMIDPVEEADVSGHYRHPFCHQTLLTSDQLAVYVQFPSLETNGFAIVQVPDFDTVPPSVNETSLEVGTVVERQRITTTPFGFPPDKLTRHAFVTGITRSGKTNTVFHLLRQVDRAGIPFLVIEPAKTEYRALLHDEQFAKRLQVFTVGNETVSPFRLNPFEKPESIPVGVHIDLLRSVFSLSFGMWTPLPQVLEVSLHHIYNDRGWDVTSGTNRRLDGDSDQLAAFPTLTDLLHKIEEVALQLGYEDRITADIRAALRTRLNSLRTGGKGRMLDVRRTHPIELLLERPTVLELESMGDDDDKAFMMGLLMIRLAEHRRTQSDVEELRHLLIIEEAHRLLANPRAHREEAEADARGKAVETFSHLLSEVGAYGQGVVVVDQIPAKLAPDVVKNTNLKVAHQVVAGDDRETLCAAMTMTPRQSASLATLPRGQAAVFTDGQDAPLLLQVPKAKGGSGTWPTNDQVRQHMTDQGLGAGPDDLLPSSDCDERCIAATGACEIARRLVDDPTVMRSFTRTVLSAVLTPGGVERSWPDLVAAVEPHRPEWLNREALLACVVRHGARTLADRRGSRAGWTFAKTSMIGNKVDETLVAHLLGRDTANQVTELRVWLLALQGGGYGPFEGCSHIWGDRLGPCLCRYPVADLVAGGGFDEVWESSRNADRASENDGHSTVWDVCQDAAYQLVEFPTDGQGPELVAQMEDVARCTALCFAQQMLAAEEWAHPSTQRRLIVELIAEAGHQQLHRDGGITE